MLISELRGYHGSRSDGYPIFYLGHTGYNSHTFGDYESTRYGAFFTNNPEVAKQYGDVRTYEFDPQHVLDMDRAVAGEGNVIWDFVSIIRDVDWDVFQDARNMMLANAQAWMWFEDEVGKYFIYYLRERGYDAATFEEEIGDEISQTVVVLDMTKIIGNQLSMNFDENPLRSERQPIDD